MPWEYLDNMNYRYEIISNKIDFKNKHVVDLCSGNTGLYELVKDITASYRACDLRKLHPIVEQVSDEIFAKTIQKCDILCAFGYGGREIADEKLESETLNASIRNIISKHNPEHVVLESIKNFQKPIFNIADSFDYTYETISHDSSFWLEDRIMIIMKRKRVGYQGLAP